MPLQQLVRVTLTMFDGQTLKLDDVTTFDPVNNFHAYSLTDPRPFETRIRLVTLERGDMEMDGRMVRSVVVEGDGISRRYEMTHSGLQEVAAARA